jgi:hypothetical protein
LRATWHGCNGGQHGVSLQRREILGREASKLALSDDQRRKLEEEM